MYRRNDSLGCLSVSVWRIGEDVPYNELIVGVERIGNGLSASVWRIGDGLKVSASIVCSVNKDAYLDVAPDVVWISSDMLDIGEFNIMSNTKWFIN